MKNYSVRVISLLIVLQVIILGIVGCMNNQENDFVPPDYVYNPDVVQFPLPEGIAWIDNITVHGESIYFTGMPVGYEEAPFTSQNIYVMSIDGTNVRMLQNYSVATDIPEDAEEGYTHIQAMFVDQDDNVWVAERSRIEVLDLTHVRKLDSTGAELSSYDVSHLSAGKAFFNITAFAVDDSNNFYIGADSSVYVFSSYGRELFSTDVGWVERLVNTPTGAVAHFGWTARGRALSVFDVTARGIGEIIDLPSGANKVYRGNEEFSFIFTNDIGLYVIDAESKDEILLVNWMESNLLHEGLENITLLLDGRILTTNRNRNREGSNYEIIILAKVPYIERPEAITLTLATFYLNHTIQNAVIQFNSISTTHRIHVIDYSGDNSGGITFGDAYKEGLMRFTTEIISGNVPDIIDVSVLPFNQFIAKGLLLDLYPLIDADPDLNRSDFLENILRITEVDGGLYRIFPYFYIDTMIGNPSVIGSYPGWNIDEFIAVVNAHPEAEYPFGQGFTKEGLLWSLVMYNINNFVDWHAGTVHFDSDEFKRFMEFTNTLPDTFEWDDEITDVGLMRSGQQIIRATSLSDFNTYRMYKALFGGDLVFKGFPNESRNGSSMQPVTSFAITTKCSDVDGAWDFLRTLFMDDWQYENDWVGFPTNQNTFDRLLTETMTRNDRNPESLGWEDFSIRWTPLEQEDADLIIELINSLSGSVGRDEAIWAIVNEGASGYFNGQSTAQDAARIIQNRVSRYVAEQG